MAGPQPVLCYLETKNQSIVHRVRDSVLRGAQRFDHVLQ